MELRHLRYFEAVARHSHVTRAAAELHIAQPALSKQISQLEHELGVALFDRIGRNVRLTEAGEALLPHARAILAKVEEARASMAERAQLKRGRASVGAPPSVSTTLLPHILAAFRQRYNGIELRIHEAGVQTLLDLLDAGLADAAIVTLPLDHPSLEVTALLTEELVIAAPKSHSLAQRQRVAMRDLARERWILPPANYDLREAAIRACDVAGFKPVVVVEGGEMDTLVRLVSEGVGIALVPQMVVTPETDVVCLHLSDQTLTRTLGVVWRSDRVASPAARALREFLVSSLRSALPA